MARELPAWAASAAVDCPATRCACRADTLRLLLVMGSACNLADKEGCTPLHWAAIRGHTEACTVLLQVGALQPGCRCCCCCSLQLLAAPHAALSVPLLC